MKLPVLIDWLANVKPYLYLLINAFFFPFTILPVCHWLNFQWAVYLAEALRERERRGWEVKGLLHLNLIKRKRHRSSLVQGRSKQTTFWNGGIDMVESLADGNALWHTEEEQFRSFAHATSCSKVLCSRWQHRATKYTPRLSLLPCYRMVLSVRLNKTR